MYQLTKIKPHDLNKVVIKNQDKIIEATGFKLEPQKAYEVLKNDTKNFTIEHEKAKLADKLFSELLQKNGINLAGVIPQPDNRLRLQAQARAKALDLLELELKLTG